MLVKKEHLEARQQGMSGAGGEEDIGARGEAKVDGGGD